MSEQLKGKIIVHLTEKETTELDDNGNVKNIIAEGLLSVKNQSKEHRLWNLKLNVDKNDTTNLAKTAAKESLETGSNWDFDYKMNNVKEPILKLTEIIDCSKMQEGVNHNLALNVSDESSITITLANTQEKPIQNIELLKDIPAYLKEVKIAQCSGGSPNFNLETKKLVWTIPILEANQSVTLVLKGRNEIKDSAQKSGNPVDVTYVSDMNVRSGIKPSIEGLTDTMSGVSQEEDDSKPGRWNCVVEFSNESDFDITLKNVKVGQKIATGEETVVSDVPAYLVSPGKSWTKNFSVESPSVPSLNPKLEFTPNFAVPTIIIGKIHQQAQTFNVIETKLEKDINPPTVKANANTDMVITVTLSNMGSACIDSVQYKDIIPRDFEAPSIDAIQAVVMDGSGKETKLDHAKAVLDLAPANKDTTVPHNLNIEFKELNAIFVPKSRLVVKYPIIARNPLPNVRYETPVSTTVNSAPKGLGYPDQPKEMPVIGIQYIKRKVKSMKSINPSGKPGEFNVVVKITNSGGVELENITVIEEIPGNFQCSGFKPEDNKPEFVPGSSTSTITWIIKRLDPEQSVKFEYISAGSGEFPRTEPQVIIAESDSLKTDKGPRVVVGEGASAKDQDFKSKNQGVVVDIFDGLVRKFGSVVAFDKASSLLEESRDQLLAIGKSSPVFHEIIQEIREMKKMGDKLMVGPRLEDIKKKIADWRARLIA